MDPEVRPRFLSAVGPGFPFRHWHGSFFPINMNERSSNVVSLFVVMVPDEHANNPAYVNGTMSIALNFALKPPPNGRPWCSFWRKPPCRGAH